MLRRVFKLLALLTLIACTPPAGRVTSSAPSALSPPSASATFSATPAPTTAAATSTPVTSAGGTEATAAEKLADTLADALEASDYDALRPLISPRGWIFAMNGTEGGQPMTADDTISRLRRGAADGRLQVRVQRRPVLPRTNGQPPGDSFVQSTWMQFDGRPEQKVDLVVRNQSGAWYWSGALFGSS